MTGALYATLSVFAGAAALSASIILGLLPILRRHALARAEARSSHIVPTPQGGGIAVVLATLSVAGAAALSDGSGLATITSIGLAALALMIVGALDDVTHLSVWPRIVVQIATVSALVLALGGETRLIPIIPLSVERALLVLAGLWFVNLTNFMDGLDWMMVAEILPLSLFVAIGGLWWGIVPHGEALVALALAGAIAGFAPFNKPVAQLFLGDAGSLPIGLMTAALLFALARAGYVAAAILLPLYFVADASVTLIRRTLRGEALAQAHRTHFYQRATDNGFSVIAIAIHVLVLNTLLAALAGITILFRSPWVDVGVLVAGLAATALVLIRFQRPRRIPPER